MTNDTLDLTNFQFTQKIQSLKRPLGLVTGVFDLLHPGHLFFLEKSKAFMRDKSGSLVLGLEPDARVRQLKGLQRPVQKQVTREQQLEQTHLIDFVFILPENFSSPDIRKLILSRIESDYLLVSSSSPNLINKQRMMQQIGGELVQVCAHQPGYSTTEMLKLDGGRRQ